MKKVIAIISFATLIIFSSGWAEIYKWVDEKGTVYFTDDPATIPEKYRDSAKQKPREERQWKGSPEGQQTRGSTDMMEEMVRKFPGLSYQWTQDMSLWIGVPASYAADRYSLSEMAAKIAKYYHDQKGHSVCVRFYYGDGKVIARECR